jgi:hypothetical protein
LEFGIRRRQIFDPIPADVHQARLIIPCESETGKELEIPLSSRPISSGNNNP